MISARRRSFQSYSISHSDSWLSFISHYSRFSFTETVKYLGLKIVSIFVFVGWAIACYECVTTEDPACADPFNPWKFNPVICKGDGSDGEVKCASQKEHSSSSR
jgi:hypothetical protein